MRTFQAETTPKLPAIPGGWITEEIAVQGHSFHITRPAIPDQLLDDPAVIAANRQDDAMPYWAYLWPATRSMARAVLERNWQPETRVLEIGAGIGFVGLAACARGMQVVFSDYQAEAVELAVHNARRNGFRTARGMQFDWRHPVSETFPVILGCDLLYELRNHSPILSLLQRMLTPDGVCWIGDPGRRHAARFYEEARQRAFLVELEDRNGMPLPEPIVGTFQLFKLSRRR